MTLKHHNRCCNRARLASELNAKRGNLMAAREHSATAQYHDTVMRDLVAAEMARIDPHNTQYQQTCRDMAIDNLGGY